MALDNGISLSRITKPETLCTGVQCLLYGGVSEENGLSPELYRPLLEMADE